MDRGLAWTLSLGVGLGMAPGCGSPSTEGGMDSAVSAARLNAIQAAARQDDASAVPRLVECLDSDDIAVRTAAIATLEDLTGERFGYEPDAPLTDRRASIEQWAAYVDSRGLTASAEEGGS